MVKNYLLVAFRHLKRQPAYSLLNILGLTIGIVSSLLIVLYLSNELGYDKHNTKADRIFRVNADIREPDNAFRWASSQLPMRRTVAAEFDEIESYVRIVPNGIIKFQIGDISYLEEDVFLVDSTMFDVFSYDLIAGNPATALMNPNSIVLSESMAKKIFKEEDPMGKILKTEARPYNVTGIYKDVTTQSHIRPRGLISLNSSPDNNNARNWGKFGIYTYFLLNEGVKAETVEKKLEGIVDKYVAVIFDQFKW